MPTHRGARADGRRPVKAASDAVSYMLHDALAEWGHRPGLWMTPAADVCGIAVTASKRGRDDGDEQGTSVAYRRLTQSCPAPA